MDAESMQTLAYEETIRILTAQISRRDALITELCDALEFWAYRDKEDDEYCRPLIERAREATR